MNGIATNFFPAMPFFSEAAEAYSPHAMTSA
jgi:hypothetical protein